MLSKKSYNNYLSIVNDILENEEFSKLKLINHHGITRYNHSLRVSYYSYIVTKILRLDYVAAARAGLLHDFFIDTYNDVNNASLLYDHPYIACDNARKYFDINKKEEDIIKCHMFPVNPTLPKYIESWIVCINDDIAAILEKLGQFRFKLSYLMNFYFLFLLNFMK